VLGAVLAWALHDQALSATQIAGGFVVLAAVVWVQLHRPLVTEAAPTPARKGV
jgi:drug/metabolite transporter (DMT)-like permease